MKNIARIYIRQSGREKGEKISPEVQKEHCERVARENGWRVVIYDEGEGMHSAYKRTALPQWEKLFHDTLNDKSTAAVIAYDLARSFRNSVSFQEHVKQILAQKVEFIFAVEGAIDFASADSKMMWGFRSEIAEYESRKTSERLLNYHAKLKRSGIYAGHYAPAGLSRQGHANNGTLKFVPNETMRTVKEFFKLYARGKLGVHNLARELNRRGLRWTNGKRVIPQHLQMTLRNLAWYTDFISPDLMRQIVQVKASRAQRQENGRALKHAPLLLWRLLFCDVCGARYYQAGSYHRASVYQHPYNDCAHAARKFASHLIDAQVWKHLRAKFILTDEQLDALALDMAAPRESAYSVTALHLEREKISESLEKLKFYLIEGDIDQAEFRAMKEKYNARLEEIHTQLSAMPVAAPSLTLTEARALLQQARSVVEKIETPPENLSMPLNDFMRLLFKQIKVLDNRVVGYVYQF